MNINISELTADLGEPKDYRVERDGDLDLAFRGWEIGADGQSGGSGRTTEVDVYLTTGGKIVLHVCQSSRWQGEQTSRNRAVAIDTPGEAVQWLKDDARGTLGQASKQAWGEACANVPDLEDADVELLEGPTPGAMQAANLRSALALLSPWGVDDDARQAVLDSIVVCAGEVEGCTCPPEDECSGCLDVHMDATIGAIHLEGKASIARDPVNDMDGETAWAPLGTHLGDWLSCDLADLVDAIGSKLGEEILSHAADAARQRARYPVAGE